MSEHDTIWVIEVQWKRRKGQPVEALGSTTSGPLRAMCLATECAKKLKVPQSWVNAIPYHRYPDKAKEQA